MQMVLYILVFLAVGAGFLMVNLVVGRFVRPNRPNAEKATVYECGEPTIGPSWIQFDLRFYVVALLFVIFDVEMAFFFPWATVFGTSTKLAREDIGVEARAQLQKDLLPEPVPGAAGKPADEAVADRNGPVRKPQPGAGRRRPKAAPGKEAAAQAAPGPAVVPEKGPEPRMSPEDQVADQRSAAKHLAWIAFADIVVFFGVLLVGFAYLWKRGDLDWVRSTAAQQHGLAADPRQAEMLAVSEKV